jgi:hypothetical protein
MPGLAEEGNKIHNHKKVSDRETLEMMKAFKRIGAESVRKRLSDLVRAIADSQAAAE